MQDNIILAGVGGQGILSIAASLAMGALGHGLYVKQSEVHGMSQRGGAVLSHIRISSEEVHSVLIPKGTANALLSIEPMEALRYLPILNKDGWLITNTSPYKIPNYPDLGSLYEELEAFPNHILIDADKIAKGVGTKKAANIVILGAASLHLSMDSEMIKEGIKTIFSGKGDKIVKLNLDAFEAGRQHGEEAAGGHFHLPRA